jgi:predicted alpha/beta hydrolase family esterase
MGPVRHLIVHGWQGSGPGHWQRWLARRLSDVAFPVLPAPDRPRLGEWMDALRAELERTCDPVVLCHSLGCMLWLHHAASRDADAPRASRVLLVAPPGPSARFAEIAEFLTAPLDPGALAAACAGETRLVCSDDDPYCSEGADGFYGVPLGIPTEVIPGGGHLNTDSGHGPWPAVEAWARGERPTLAVAGEV